jgi:hypothetical protein
MDEFEKEYWNQKQVRAWVAGDRRLVEDAADNQETNEGLRLTNIGRLMRGVSELRKAKGKRKERWRSPKEKVLCELQQGNLKAFGAKNDVGDLQPVPPHLWADLDLYLESDHAGPKRGKPKRGVSRWYRLIFPREEVMALWPDEEKAPPQRSPRGRKAGPYLSRLRGFLEWYDTTRPGGLEGAESLTKLCKEARQRLEAENVRGVPKWRSGLEDQVKRIKSEIIANRKSR